MLFFWRILAASVANERMESMEPVSQVRIWVEGDEHFWRSVRSVDEERTQARIVLSSERESWRTNSRPRPRFAPGFLGQEFLLYGERGGYC